MRLRNQRVHIYAARIVLCKYDCMMIAKLLHFICKTLLLILFFVIHVVEIGDIEYIFLLCHVYEL